MDSSTGDSINEFSPHQRAPKTAPRLIANLLQRQARFVPNIVLHARGPLSVRYRAPPFELRCLRDVWDILRDCEATPGDRPDYLDDVLALKCGTLGAKQALIAALAQECGRDDVQLTVGCGELTVARVRGLESLFAHRSTLTLPLAVCYLRCHTRRLQVSSAQEASQMTSPPHSEKFVDPRQLPEQRVRLYQEFAADWCRVYDLTPKAFAQLRAGTLRAVPYPAAYEDLLGHTLDHHYQPVLGA